MLDQVAEKLQEKGLVGESWLKEVQDQAKLVRLYRDYFNGQHRQKLTNEMKAMMQIKDPMDRYNANYCEMVITAMAARLEVEAVTAIVENEGDNPAQDWADAVSRNCRLDGLQIGVHEAVLRDGVTYVMSQYDEVTAAPRFAQELAWDGDSGVIIVKDARGAEILAGIKVWWVGDTRYANMYYPNQTEKYIVDGGSLTLIKSEDTTRNGVVPGVPIVEFKNKGGVSELENIIPLQDSLNRTLISLIMSGELAAFSLLFARGFKPDAALSPGMIIHAMISDGAGRPVTPTSEEEARAYAAMLQNFDLKRIEGGSLTELIGQADFIIGQIATISSTPIPGQMGGDSSSGEALKQRDARLLGKVRRAQVQLGNAWEDVFALAHGQQGLFGYSKPPDVLGWSTNWKTAELRDDANIRETAKLLHEWGYEREALRLLSQSASVNFSEADIDRMMDERRAESAAVLSAAAGALPGFGAF